MNRGPSVTRIVMFKHGVAYLERSGPAQGDFELSFKRAEMNDVLKSLAVWVARGDARVGAVAFEAPEDPEAALARRKLALEPGAAFEGLLASLGGRRVKVDDGGAMREGDVVGIQQTPAAEGALRRQLVLRTAEGTLAIVDLASARSLELCEESSRSDLEFLVDRRRAAMAGDARTVRVGLAGAAEDLRVAYVIPAPVWRVSYRLAREAEATTLMAWGIVHNPADEDLEGVELTLTTGQPVSFVIDLYEPKRVQRAVVEEQSRAAAPPTRFERARSAPRPAPGMAPPPPPAAMPMSYAAAGPFLDEDTDDGSYTLVDRLAQTAEGASVGVDRGEFFEYRVQAKVSLKRGGSAMVPLVAARVKSELERIWRDGHGPSPDLVLTFTNDSGVVLEEGPAVVYDGGAYAGESMVPYAARGADVKLAFAKDLAVRCRLTTTQQSVLARVRLGPNAAVEDHYREEPHTLLAESDHAEPVDVVFELPKLAGRVLHPEGVQPFEETASYRRFKATVPPHGKAELVVRERWSEARQVNYTHLSAKHLQSWLEGRFLDAAAVEALGGVLARWQECRALEQRLAWVENEQKVAYTKQTKISEQLAVLKDGGPEGALRLRYVKELETEQDKVNHCEAEMRRLRDAAETTKNLASQALAQLTARPSAS